MFDNDIVRDILRRVVEAAQQQGGFDDAMARQIEEHVRRDWGGAEPYIATGLVDRLAERNDKIVALYDSGTRDVRMLATRFGLSVKQVRRIIDR